MRPIFEWLIPLDADMVANLGQLNRGQLPTAWFGALGGSYVGEHRRALSAGAGAASYR